MQCTDTSLSLRAILMERIRDYIADEGLTQAEAAERFGVAQPRISEIVQGRVELFSMDKLVNLLARVGQQVQIKLVS
jgi:predicted XRE-type DNA-binding protein